MFLGNHFETLVSVLYLDSPETCTKWMFKVYDAVRNNLTASNGKETFLDKEKYIRLYEHQLKPIHFIEYTAIWVANRVYLFFQPFHFKWNCLFKDHLLSTQRTQTSSSLARPDLTSSVRARNTAFNTF